MGWAIGHAPQVSPLAQRLPKIFLIILFGSQLCRRKDFFRFCRPNRNSEMREPLARRSRAVSCTLRSFMQKVPTEAASGKIRPCRRLLELKSAAVSGRFMYPRPGVPTTFHRRQE